MVDAWDVPLHTPGIPRPWVHAVVEAPRGAAFTSCDPDYGRDEAAQKAYAVAAKDPTTWASWLADWMEA